MRRVSAVTEGASAQCAFPTDGSEAKVRDGLVSVAGGGHSP